MHIEEEAARLFRENRRSGYSARHGLDYAYTCPSTSDYPYQWSWDSCFHALALRHLDAEWAQRELRSMVSVQRADGFLPHVIFWPDGSPSQYWKYLQADNPFRPRVTAYIQPPVLAVAALAVFRSTGDREFAAEMLAAARSFHQWLRRTRDPDRDGLISTVSPFESGLDWSPQFDRIFRHGPKRNLVSRGLAPRVLDLRHWLAGHDDARMLKRYDVEEVLTNCIWYEGQVCLSELAGAIGDDETAADEATHAGKTEESLLIKCWDREAGAFFSLAGSNEDRLPVRTAASLAACLLDDLGDDQLAALVSDIENPRRFGTRYPLPSVSVDEPSFQQHPGVFLWRGPTWINLNWLVLRGLLKHSEDGAAASITSGTVSLIEQSGFRECYGPHDAKGMGARDFGWSTLVIDMMRLNGE